MSEKNTLGRQKFETITGSFRIVNTGIQIAGQWSEYTVKMRWFDFFRKNGKKYDFGGFFRIETEKLSNNSEYQPIRKK